MTGTLEPRTVASIDQCRAEITDLVAKVRDHAASGCSVPGMHACVGWPVLHRLRRFDPDTLRALLVTAVADLAYTNPTS